MTWLHMHICVCLCLCVSNMCVCVCVLYCTVLLSVVSDSATPWTVARQALSMGFSRQGYCSGLPCPPPGGLPDPGIELVCVTSPGSPALANGFSTLSHLGRLYTYIQF